MTADEMRPGRKVRGRIIKDRRGGYPYCLMRADELEPDDMLDYEGERYLVLDVDVVGDMAVVTTGYEVEDFITIRYDEEVTVWM